MRTIKFTATALFIVLVGFIGYHIVNPHPCGRTHTEVSEDIYFRTFHDVAACKAKSDFEGEEDGA